MRPRTKKSTLPRVLTATELEMMNVIWQLGPCSVAQVQAALRPQRDLAYTSVSTIVRILVQKGFVGIEKEGRGHLYSALVSKPHYQALTLEHLVAKVFDATPTLLVQRLLDSQNLTAEEIARIRALLRSRGPA